MRLTEQILHRKALRSLSLINKVDHYGRSSSDKNKPANADELPVPLIVMVKFRGSVSDVTAALEAAKARAEELAGVVTEYKIARPTEDTEKMLKLTGLDKGEPHIINEKDIEEI